MPGISHILGILVHILQNMGHISTTMACYDALINIFFELKRLISRGDRHSE